MLSVQVRAAASSQVSGSVMTRLLAESSGRYTALKPIFLRTTSDSRRSLYGSQAILRYWRRLQIPMNH